MLSVILIVASFVYVLQMFVFAVAAKRSQYSFNYRLRPTVSIIIAARNEKINIRQALESLTSLTYPRDLHELIFVDDRSADNTQSIASEFMPSNPHLKIITATPSTNHLQGKTNALAQGIKESKGEILLFTDADCKVPRHWIENIVKYYDEEHVGIVAGFTSLQARTWFEGMQALDWFFLYSVAAGMIRLNFPATVAGNNFTLRRKAYNQVGGYEQLPFSVTEDYALFNAIVSKTHYIARFPLDRDTMIESKACNSLMELYRQKRRWFVGLLEMDWKRLAVFGIGYLPNALLLTATIMLGIRNTWVAIILKLVADFIMVYPSLSQFRKASLLKYFLQFEVFYFSYVLILPLTLIFNRTVIWKDQTFKK